MRQFGLCQRLTDPATWKPSTVAQEVLITRVTPEDAAALAQPGESRDAVEAFIEAHTVVSPDLRGVVLLVVGNDESAIGFIEVRTSDVGVYLWNGPHAPLGRLFPTPGETTS